MNLGRRMVAVVFAIAPCMALAVPPAQPRPATVAFLENHTGTKAVLAEDAVGVVFGKVLATRSDQQTTRAFVEDFLITDENIDILGVDSVELAYDNDFTSYGGKFKIFTYRQVVAEEDDLPMHNSIVKVVVLAGETEKIVHLGGVVMHEPESSLPSDVKSAQDALDIVEESDDYGHLTDFSTPEKVIYNPYPGSHHRAWRFYGWDDDEDYQFFVDTNTGEIVDAIDVLLFVDPDIAGTVEGYATPGTSADDPEVPGSAPVPTALPGIRVTLTGEDPVFADADGNYEFATVGGSPVAVTSVLESEWAKVICDPLSSSSDLTDTVANVVPPASGVDLLFNPPGAGRQPSEDTSQVNAFLAVHTTHEWFSVLQPDYPLVDQQLTIVVNKPYTHPSFYGCNSGYFPGSSPPMITAWVPTLVGDYCNNSAFSTVTSHEYGHFLLDIFVRNMIDPAFHEGIADTVSSLKNDTSCMFENWFGVDNSGYRANEPCVRRVDAVAVNENYGDFTTTACAPNGCEVQLFDDRCNSTGIRTPHCRGLALAQSFWDLRTEIGDAATERLFADFLAITRGVLDHSVIAEVLVADDSDGDLTTTSTNQEDIISAFTAHGWEDPTATGTGVEVTWLGPVGQYSTPEEGTDYTVNYEIIPPAVTLISTEKGGQAVFEWQIGREVDSMAADIGAITTDWTGTAHDIKVRVGDPAYSPCRILYSVDIERQSTTTWSSLILRLETELVGRARAVASSSGAGGLIEGSIRRAGDILAQGIGGGANTPGDLEVSYELRHASLGTIMDGSTLEISALVGNPLIITGELHGAVQINDYVQNALLIEGTGESTGSITLLKNLDEQIRFAGPMSGAITVFGNVRRAIIFGDDMSGYLRVLGEIQSLVRVTSPGEFTGDICASNVGAGQANGYFDFDFGTGGSICGHVIQCVQDNDCNDSCTCTTDTCVNNWCDFEQTSSGCTLCAPAPARAPETAPKNRYLTFVPPRADNVAIRVTLSDSTRFASSEGETGWVGQPDTNGMALWVSSPVYREWTEDVVYLRGCKIAPESLYELEATANGTVFSTPLEISTVAAPGGSKDWGDITGGRRGLQWAPPDGVVNINDALACVFGYSNPSIAPHRSWLDVEGLGGWPNGVINFNDVFALLKGFVGAEYPFPDPDECADEPPGESTSGNIEFRLVADEDLIDPSDNIAIDVYVDPASDLAAYELALDITGGDSGSLDVRDMVIYQSRTDFVFSGENVVDGVDETGVRLGAAMLDGTGVTVTSTNDYLGTFLLTASSGASGTFEVRVKTVDKAFLTASTLDKLETTPGDSILIGVDVECTIESHCNDLSECTDDACVSNVCQYTNNYCDDTNDCTTDTCYNGVCVHGYEDSGTPCSDGLFCTTPDECDGAGTCLSGTEDPCEKEEECIEFLDVCKGEE